MKKLMTSLLFIVGLLSPLFGQVLKPHNGGFYWSDSLYGTYIDTVGVDDTIQARTTSVVSMNFNSEWLSIVATDSNGTAADSGVVEFKTMGFSLSSTPTRNFWNVIPFMKDSTWTNANVLTGGNSFMLYVGGYDSVRVRRTDVGAITDTAVGYPNVWRIDAIINKKK